MAKSSTRKKPVKSSGRAALPEWNLDDLYPGIDSPALKRDMAQADEECVAFEQAFKGRLAAMAAGEGARAGRGGRALRGTGRQTRAARLLCAAPLFRRHHRPDAREVLWRRAGAHHRGLAAPFVFHARAQPHRRRRAGGRDARSRARPLPAVDRGRAQGEAVSARGSRRGAVPREIDHRLLGLEPAI